MGLLVGLLDCPDWNVLVRAVVMRTFGVPHLWWTFGVPHCWWWSPMHWWTSHWWTSHVMTSCQLTMSWKTSWCALSSMRLVVVVLAMSGMTSLEPSRTLGVLGHVVVWKVVVLW